MKKLVIIAILTIAAAGLKAQTQTQQTLIYDPSFFSFAADDTFRVNKRDLIAAMTIVNPDWSTDTVLVKGRQVVIDGYTSGWVKIPPSNHLSLGYNDNMRIDSVMVVTKDKSWVATSPTKY